MYCLLSEITVITSMQTPFDHETYFTGGDKNPQKLKV